MTGGKSRRDVRLSLCAVVAVLAMSVQFGSVAPAALGASPPVIESVGVSDVTDSNAVLSAVIDPVEGGAYYQFQIAADPSEFASEILCPEDFEAGTGPSCEGPSAKGVLPIGELWGETQAVELDLSDAGVTLQSGSAYYFRVLVARAADEEEDEVIEWEEPTVVGETRDFTTGNNGGEPSVPPVLAVPLSIPSYSVAYDLIGTRPLCRGERIRRRGRVLCVKPRFCRGIAADAALKASSRRASFGTPKGLVLLVDERQVRAGRRAYARLANFRDTDVAYRHAFSIERWTKDGWEMDPSSPDGPWPKSMDRLAPGEAGKCYVFDVPRKQPAGRYRFSATDVQLKPLTKFSLTWESASFRVKR